MNLLLESVDSEQYPELLQPGRYELEISLPALWLQPNSYASRIKIIAHPYEGKTERYYSEWLDVSVTDESVSIVSGCLLAPDSKWSIRSMNEHDELRETTQTDCE